jgi:hypothetical protein
MSACKYTERISASECIGDSLTKINQNFENLDQSLCEQTDPKPGHATTVSTQITELGEFLYKVNAQNSYAYNARFDSLQVATYNPVTLTDGTPLMVTTFPYDAIPANPKPIATFTSIALTDKPPVVSLYWVASGNKIPLTTFNLNSATPTNKGQTWFNGTVTSLLSTGNSLYVGGTFTAVGSALAEKVARINLTTPTGTVDSANPITNLGEYGEVRQITETTITIAGSPRTFIAFGGSFENAGIRGRGLLIFDSTTGAFHHFYVNGEVNALRARDNILWVGGKFDYVNYGTSSASTFSGRRIYSNGLFTVALNGLAAGLTTATIEDKSTIFEERATVNAIELYQTESLLYLGGEFKIKETVEKLKCQNVCCINSNGTLYESWRPIINGPVYKLKLDDNRATGSSVYLYIGGEFTEVYSQTQFYLSPRIKDEDTIKFYNAFAVKLTDLASLRSTPETIITWKPKFNGPVTNLLPHDDSASSHIYCYGKQTTVNDVAVNYLVAITKASSFGGGKIVTEWTPAIQNSPSLINNALIRGSNGLIVGGNFTEVNTAKRYNLAEIADTTATLPALSGFVWDFGAQSLAVGSNLSFNTSHTSRVSAYPFVYDGVNVTSFAVPSDVFQGLRHGQLLRFTVKRPGNSATVGVLSATDDTFKSSVHVIGYKVDFN